MMRCLHVMSLLAVLLMLCACADDAGEALSPQLPERTPVEQRIERGPIVFIVRASSDAVRVGEKLTLEVTVQTPLDATVTMPAIENELGVFAVRSRVEPLDIPDETSRTWNWSYQLDTFAVGDQEIPTLDLTYTDGDGENHYLASDVMLVSVLSVLGPDETLNDMRDVKPLLDLEFAEAELDNTSIWWWAGGSLGLVLILLTVFMLMRRKGRTDAVGEVIPAHIWARRELARLAQSDLLERGEYEPFFVAVSSIARGYLERRFGMRAPERTTPEFLDEAAGDTRLTDGQRLLLVDFLTAADMVKFARLEPTKDAGQEAIQAALTLVEQTVPTHGSLETGEVER